MAIRKRNATRLAGAIWVDGTCPACGRPRTVPLANVRPGLKIRCRNTKCGTIVEVRIRE